MSPNTKKIARTMRFEENGSVVFEVGDEAAMCCSVRLSNMASRTNTYSSDAIITQVAKVAIQHRAKYGAYAVLIT